MYLFSGGAQACVAHREQGPKYGILVATVRPGTYFPLQSRCSLSCTEWQPLSRPYLQVHVEWNAPSDSLHVSRADLGRRRQGKALFWWRRARKGRRKLPGRSLAPWLYPFQQRLLGEKYTNTRDAAGRTPTWIPPANLSWPVAMPAIPFFPTHALARTASGIPSERPKTP